MKRTNTAKWIESAQRWQINVQKDGVRKTFTSAKPGRTGQREANRKADAWLDNGISTERIKVCAAWQLFLEQKRLVSEDEAAKIESFGRIHLLPKIGSKTVAATTEQDCQGIINYAYSHPVGARAAGDTLSRKTLQNFANYIKQFVKFCRNSKWTTLEFDKLDIPKGARYEGRDTMTVENLQKLMQIDTTIYHNKRKKDSYINYYRFQVFTGMRPGEMRGLRWKDVKGNVCKLHQAINKNGKTTRGKNDNALRTVVLSQYALDVLENQREYTGNNEYIFPMTSMHTYYGRWKKYQESNGMQDLSLYEMRHTFVSIAKELPEGEVKQIVGHSKNMDTYGQYSHYLRGDNDRVAQNLQHVFEILTDGKSTH
nr:MAG TPA: Integrase [Caudoviricetes sp.]